MKILSPAGNFESLKMAVFNGADEVYLGINDFNARNNIDGFSLSNLKEAVDFAHIFGVKVNLAINILFTDEELQKALDIVVDSYNLGVDCFIIQDLGLASLIYKNYPEIEIHASTQMGLHNLEGVKAVEKFGFKRVVLARETPLEEIKRIKDNSKVEIEYFAHGALCVSFSGNCYLSSYLCNASGNRGKCKQLCRLPYTLMKDNKVIKEGYLLSAKDFNMIDKLKDLENAGVDVLKIEGRARRPYYVGITTAEYIKALNRQKVNHQDLMLGFNRNYTAGYFDGNGDIISNIQNHIGLKIGKIEKVVIGKKFNEIYISSNQTLSPKSSFKVFDKNREIATFSAYDLTEIKKGYYRVTSTQKLKTGYNVHLIVDYNKEENMLKTVKKKEIEMLIFAEVNKPIKATFNINNTQYEVLGDILDKASNQPLTIEDLNNNFIKTELFKPTLLVKALDNVFIPKQKLNSFRRQVYDKIISILTATNRKQINSIKVSKPKNKIKAFCDFQVVESLEDDFNKTNILYSPSVYELKDIVRFQDKCKSLGKKAILDTPNFALKEDIELLTNIINETKISIVANNYYALNFDSEIIIGAGLNVYNHTTASVLNKPIITAESEISSRIDYPYMTLRHCPMKSHLKANCASCPYTDGFSYKMDNGKTLKLKRKKLNSCTFYLV